jgi:hypothetical protein
MTIQPTDGVQALQGKVWVRRLSWALPLFFLVKGLLWLVPFVSVLHLSH